MPRGFAVWKSVRSAIAVGALLTGLLVATPANAASNIGTAGPSFAGVSQAPTAEKPQSKLWYNAGSWWAYMWVTGGGYHIERLDGTSRQWVDTGVVVDSRADTLADAFWDGAKLYIASHVYLPSTIASPLGSTSGNPARLYRYSYSGGQYTLDAGFPTTIGTYSTESLTIDEDSTGRIWSTWTQVSGSLATGYTSTVYVNVSSVGGTTWQSPFVLPVSDPNASADDISAVVSYQSKIGVMWSDQNSATVWWAWRNDGSSFTDAASWHAGSARSGPYLADDHINLKTLQADASGRVFASVKTGLDASGIDSNAQLVLLVYEPGANTFTSATISTVGDCETRPQVVLNSSTSTVHVFMTGPATDVSGCPFSGAVGAIYEKTASMDSPSFAAGRGTAVIQDGASPNLNNVTTSKQPVSSSTGLVVLASNEITQKYWYVYRAPTAPKPVASFTATPTSGTAPLAVAFADTSSGSPISWAWDFGDGTSDTTQNPVHTYGAAGVYTVKLTATNTSGSNTVTVSNAITAKVPMPVASLTATPTSGTAPLSVAFADKSSGNPSSWAWDFGDGTADTTQNPVHTYGAAGVYTVKLTATNSAGSNTVTVPKAITVSVPAPAKVTNVTVTFPKKSTVKVKWAAAANSTKYKVRLSKRNSRTHYRAWKTTSHLSRKFTKMRKNAIYRVQVIAIGPGGTSQRVTVKFRQKR